MEEVGFDRVYSIQLLEKLKKKKCFDTINSEDQILNNWKDPIDNKMVCCNTNFCDYEKIRQNKRIKTSTTNMCNNHTSLDIYSNYLNSEPKWHTHNVCSPIIDTYNIVFINSRCHSHQIPSNPIFPIPLINETELQKKYAGKYIAIEENQIFGVDKTIDGLKKQVKQYFQPGEHYQIKYIEDGISIYGLTF